MKTPLDPTEPMFPIRPNEPMCQYFMKHGTCKFGQACKFHHPPSAAQQPNYAAPAPGGSPVLLSVAPGRIVVEQATQLLAVGSPGTELTHMMVQFLPQRPEEPDCIYFLKNGRCKYGATCRYHHPIYSYSSQPAQPRQSRHPRNSHNDIYASSGPKRIPYGTQPPGATHPPRHIVLAEGGGNVSYVGIDHCRPVPATYKPVTFIASGGDILSTHHNAHGPVNGGPMFFSGSTAMTEQGSSASSIASSFDTASSSMDFTGNEAAAAALWNRARKNGSVGSLNAFDKARGQINQLPSSGSDGNIAMRTHSVSLGSAGDYYAHGDTSGARANEWRHRSTSFDRQARRSSGYGNDVATSNHGNTVVPQHASAGRAPSSDRQRQTRGSGDEGFTMMTSALLNMLDTQEETSHEAYSEDEISFVTGARFSRPGDDGRFAGHENGHHEVLPSVFMENMTISEGNGMGHSEDFRALSERGVADEQHVRWSPCNDRPHMLQAAAPHMHHHTMPRQHPTHASGGPYSKHTSDLGLYLL